MLRLCQLLLYAHHPQLLSASSVSTVQDLSCSIGRCCEFRVDNAADEREQPSLHCFAICCQIKDELSIGRHKCHLFCSSSSDIDLAVFSV